MLHRLHGACQRFLLARDVLSPSTGLGGQGYGATTEAAHKMTCVREPFALQSGAGRAALSCPEMRASFAGDAFPPVRA
jgi:hypothetical protein